MMTSDEFAQAKKLIRDTLSKRNGVGSENRVEDGKWGGDISGEVSKPDSVSASKNDPITVSHGRNTIGVLGDDFDNTGFPKSADIKQYDPIPSSFNLSLIQQVCARLDAEKAASNGSYADVNGHNLSRTDTGVKTPETSSCRSLCSGLCVGSCISFCNGCTGCTGTCQNACGGGCKDTCAGHCTGSCNEGCSDTCKNHCLGSCSGEAFVDTRR